MKQVTIKDIAKIAGVSRGTVDRVINNRGSVSEKVQDKILKIARELGYEKNIMASRLASPKIFSIAVVCPDPKSDIFWELPKAGIESAISLVKYYGIKLTYFEFNLFDKKEFEKQLKSAIESKPDAIILAPVFLKESQKYLEYGGKVNIPFITINSEINHPNVLSYTGQSSWHSGYLAGKLFNITLKPYDEVIVINLAHQISNAPHYTDKMAGLLKYFEVHSLKKNKVYWYESDKFDDEKKLKDFFKNIQSKHPKLKGLFFTNSRAYRIVKFLEDEELNKYDIIGYDMIEPNINYLKEHKINFLINQNPFQQGYNGIMNFVDHFILNKKIEKKQYLPLDIVVKENVDFYL